MDNQDELLKSIDKSFTYLEALERELSNIRKIKQGISDSQQQKFSKDAAKRPVKQTLEDPCWVGQYLTCPECGFEVKPGTIKCRYCGQKLKW